MTNLHTLHSGSMLCQLPKGATDVGIFKHKPQVYMIIPNPPYGDTDHFIKLPPYPSGYTFKWLKECIEEDCQRHVDRTAYEKPDQSGILITYRDYYYTAKPVYQYCTAMMSLQSLCTSLGMNYEQTILITAK